MDFWIVQTLNGISFGMLLFLLAAGLSLVFGLMRIVNLTHGSFYLLGAYIGLAVMERTGSFLLALVIAPLCVAALALCMHCFLLRRFYGVGDFGPHGDRINFNNQSSGFAGLSASASPPMTL